MACIVHAENWDRFRGPNGAGQGDAAAVPAEWIESNYVWKQPLPGLGHSSPVIWEDRVFVTSADPVTAEQIVLALDARSGEQLWEMRLAGAPHAMHATNSYATSTPAVDDQRLYVLWLAGDEVRLAALTHTGEQVWRRRVGSLHEKHGFGTSPVVVGDIVCVANETQDPNESVVLGLDSSTGETRWEVPRAAGKTSYATPCVWEPTPGKKLVLTASMGTGLTAFDAATGEVAWQCLQDDLPDRCVSSPIMAAGLVLVSCGSGNNGLHLIAVSPGDGDKLPREVYRLREGVPNIPTPVVADKLVFIWHDRGTVSCVDAATGKEHWHKRVGGNFHSSPVRIADRLYGVSLDGEVVVLAASKKYRLLARNELGEACQATPAVAHHRLYIRTESSLLCIGEAAAQ